MQSRAYSIGFDLGGTKLAAALVAEDGSILESLKLPVHMEREASPRRTQDRIVQLIADLALDFKRRFPRECAQPRFKGVGLASAGPLNAETGTLIYPANYPGWKIVPLRKRVEEKIRDLGFKTRVHFQNDAMAAALAEGWVGGARGLNSFCVITVGTGIGTGVILNGRPCQSRGMGSEFGHMFLDLRPVEMGRRAGEFSVEGLASGTALLRRAREKGFRGSSVEELAGRRAYRALFTDMAHALAVLCYNLSIGFHLEKIFFSGGLVKLQAFYLAETKKRYRELVRSFNPAFECPLAIAETKNRAGVVGAAFLPFPNSHKAR